jgi:hypothetical protein
VDAVRHRAGRRCRPAAPGPAARAGQGGGAAAVPQRGPFAQGCSPRLPLRAAATARRGFGASERWFHRATRGPDLVAVVVGRAATSRRATRGATTCCG